MKLGSVILLALLFAYSCNLIRPKPKSDSYFSIIGHWKENWGAGEQTNVNYSDEYIISTNPQSGLVIQCPSRNNYFFEKISFENKKLKAKLIIKDIKYNAGDSWVRYELVLQDNGMLTGIALTQAGKKAKVIWERKK